MYTRAFIKIILIISTIVFSIVGEKHYSRMARRDKKQYTTMYNDLIYAYTESNFRGFRTYSKIFLEYFQKVMIDPKCVQMREPYLKIEKLLESLDKTIQLNKLQETLKALEKEQVRLLNLEKYATYMQFLKDNNCDSLFDVEMHKYITVVTQVYKVLGKTPDAFETICQFPFLPDSFYTNEVKRLERTLQHSFLRLTAEMDIKNIQKFKKRYPGFFKIEIQNLEERCRVMDRLSLLRNENLTIQKIEKYLSHYPRDESFIKQIKIRYRSLLLAEYHVDQLAKKFLEYKTLFPDPDELYEKIEQILVTKAMNNNYLACTYYMQLFPNGKKIEEVKAWRRSMEYAPLD